MRPRSVDVQDGLAGVYKHWGRVGERNPEGYVRRSILYGYLGRWRRIGRWEQPAATLQEHPTPDPTEAVVERAAMKQALAALPPRMRAVLVLRFYEDMTEKQAAAAWASASGRSRARPPGAWTGSVPTRP